MDIQPVIAVPADRRYFEPHTYHAVGEIYLQALIDGAAAIPMIVPALIDVINADDILDCCDGLFLTGSPSNVEPRHYAGEPSKEGTLHDAARDAVTLPLARRALEVGVPLLAVCRGYQELNVVLGGTLHQRVAEVEGYHNHLHDKDDPLDVQYGPSHPVFLTEGGLLRKLADADSIMVNSLHAQGVARLGNGIIVEAMADDGLVEAFRVDESPGFNLALQWHPEWSVNDSEFSKAIFGAFGDACRQRAGQRRA